jgi:anti-sigma regulatory factor (Ser/Thr protein kinase)
MDAETPNDSRSRSTVELPATAATPSLAREFAVEALRHTRHFGLMDDVALLVTELVTNAVMHTAHPLSLTVETSSDLVRIEVRDADRRLAARPAGQGAERGRGLRIVDQLAHAWGTEQLEGDGKVVWAELWPEAG